MCAHRSEVGATLQIKPEVGRSSLQIICYRHNKGLYMDRLPRYLVVPPVLPPKEINSRDPAKRSHEVYLWFGLTQKLCHICNLCAPNESVNPPSFIQRHGLGAPAPDLSELESGLLTSRHDDSALQNEQTQRVSLPQE